MGKKSETPKAPDYSGIAEKQGDANKESWQTGVKAGRPNQITPQGSLNWSQDPTTGEWTQTSAWRDPQLERNESWKNMAQGQMTQLAGQYANNYDWNQVNLDKAPKMPGQVNYGSLGTMPNQSQYGDLNYSSLGMMPEVADYASLNSRPEVGKYNQRVTDTINALQQPGLDRARSGKEAQLAAMGIGTGTGQAWNDTQRNLGDTENRAGMNAIMSGIQQGNTEFGQQQGLYNQDITNLNNRFSQESMNRQQRGSEIEKALAQSNMSATQGFNQGMQQRQQGQTELENQFAQGMLGHNTGVNDILRGNEANLGKLSGLMGMVNPITSPQFPGVGSVGQPGAIDYMGAANSQYGAALDKTNAGNADKSNTMSTLGTIGTIAATIY